MTFWIIAGLITLVAAGVTIIPVFGSSQTPDQPLEYDKEIYKARVSEIEEERALGKIDEKQYEYALAEEGRRFLALASSSSGKQTLHHKIANKGAVIGAVFAALLIPAIAISVYYNLGSLNSPDQPLQARLDADPKGQSVEELLQRAENQLIKKPQDGRGWLVVAPVYMRLGRTKEAATAYRNAIRILGPTAKLQTLLGEALTVEAGGVVTQEANELFLKASASDPDNAKPLFFLGISLNQSGDFEKATKVWNDLIAKSPTNAPWLKVARQQLQLAQSNLGAKIPGNPTSKDIQAAGELSSDERQEFINSMVERLAGELEEDPQNKPGWQRIIRSYIVLGRKNEALVAIEKAQQIFKDDADFITELEKNKLALNQ